MILILPSHSYLQFFENKRLQATGFLLIVLPAICCHVTLSTDATQRRMILYVVFKLHNYRVSEVQLSQIRRVYQEAWSESNE
ncbi:hypothetical protein BDB00DRAFT_833806 [Zychaea mexicana]|uniref:uncharacterized protein n=1 Tax=Zychaea mexicana TaxID=64656 RepID=UPI0022FF150F|nr:uncharacterized protein BDB00DRAFT_833806 [Zychaea mexicana]KAI9491285.1 hypothetical protein BDB00DRAFT_833806 [Zychaea mexicana]